MKQQFLQGDSGVFSQVLGGREIEVVAAESVEPHRERIYPPLDTLRLFVGQVLSAEQAGQDVVGRRLSEREEYASYPEFIEMREVEVNGRILVTTLFDPALVSAQSLAALYNMRWNIEVDFRAIKATLEMDTLRCKSQHMVDKEIAVYFLAYNLVRWALAKAALLADIMPWTLSFAGAKRLLGAFSDQLHRTSGAQICPLIATVTACIATLRLPIKLPSAKPGDYLIYLGLTGSSRAQRNDGPRTCRC